MYEALVKRLRELPSESFTFEIMDAMHQAADAIEELSRDLDSMNDANIALYGALPHWIPVNERLPEKPKNYPNCKLREYYFLVTLETNAVVCREYDFDNKRWPGTIRVTHWMRLPEPPKGVK